MKVFVLFIFCALTGYATAGSISWPGAIPLSAPVVKTIVPGETKTTAYSTTQYINSLPTSYSFGGHPQFTYQVPHPNSIAPLPTGYYSIGSPSYIPTNNVYYPTHPALFSPFGPNSNAGASIIPGFPSAPSSPGSSAPIQPVIPAESINVQFPQLAGDEDSAVIESAAGLEQEGHQLSNSQQNQPQFPSSNTFPNFPSNSQAPQLPLRPAPSFQQQLLIPQIPQNHQQPAQNPLNFPFSPEFPQKPQESATSYPPQPPLNPQESTPTFPQLPQTPQKPQASAPAFPQLPEIPHFAQESTPSFSQMPQKPQGSVPSFPQHPQIPQFPHESTPSFPQLPQIPQNPAQAPSNFPSVPQIPQQPGQIFSQYPQLTQDFGQTNFPQEPSQSFPSSFPGVGSDNSDLNDEDTVSVESA